MNTDEIIQGDAVSVLASFETHCVDLVVTDPPYLCRYRDKSGRTLANDDNPAAVLPVYAELYRVLKQDSYCISFYGWNAIDQFSAAWTQAGFRTVGQIVWPKPYASNARFLQYQHESAFLLAKGRPVLPDTPIPDVQPWAYSGNRNHPTEKAVAILEPLIECFSRPGDVVLDPFAGSGSTTVAAALAGRRAIGIELEERYCDLARRRLAGVRRYQETRAAA